MFLFYFDILFFSFFFLLLSSHLLRLLVLRKQARHTIACQPVFVLFKQTEIIKIIVIYTKRLSSMYWYYVYAPASFSRCTGNKFYHCSADYTPTGTDSGSKPGFDLIVQQSFTQL